jgi:hypothetical protein
MYDKHGIVLRIEVTTREVAPVKKTIYSLVDLREILLGCNHRYLAHLSALDDFSTGVRSLGQLTRPREVEGRTVKGLNFFAPDERQLLQAIQNPKGNIAGFRRRDLLDCITMLTPTRLSRQLRRLLTIGVIKRVTGTYRYYLTRPGRAAIAAAARLTEATIIPAMI